MQKSIDLMRVDWDARAQSDPRHYLYVPHGQIFKDYDSYFDAGRKHAVELLELSFDRLGFDPKGKKILEIGCGIGRLFPGFVELGFDEIWGIDVSPKMVELGKENCPVERARFVLTEGTGETGLEPNYFDFCFSYNVLQHLPILEIFWNYLTELERVLAPGAAFQLHFRGGRTTRQKLLKAIPSPVRPASQKLYRFAKMGWLFGRQDGPIHDDDSSDTWEMGVAVPVDQVRGELISLGFADVDVVRDSENLEFTRHWAIGTHR